MGKVVGFGDFLVRLNPPNYQRFIQADNFEINYTGAEANVLVYLAYNGVQTDFVTKLPQNAIAECAISTLNRFRVGTDHIARGGDRIGVYYLERGASQRPSAIIYDRKNTAISTAMRTDFDWDGIFQDATNFHFTGITPALSPSAAEICRDACEAAKRHGVVISCDLNYRASLWDLQTAQATMRRLAGYVDILIGNEEDSEKLLGVKPVGSDIVHGKLDKTAYATVARELTETYGFQRVAFTLRQSFSASDNGWSGVLYTNGAAYYSKEYMIHLVDRVGGGDSFAAGLLFAMDNRLSDQDSIEYAAAASCLKQTIPMDYNLTKSSEVLRLMDGDGSGRIMR